MSNSINIISFDVPFPANYGGVIDVYYKLVWLKKMGVKIHLHTFIYGRKTAPELESLCEKVHYYPRKTGILSNLSALPYTVKSRQSKDLEENLLSNNFPVLFEVLHTCYLLNDPRFKSRLKIYRHSNIEHDYYAHLAGSERNFFRKLYLKTEAKKLRKFEKIVSFANIILAVNEKDANYFKQNYPGPKTIYLPSFHPNNEIKIIKGKGDFILYHGNLGISENYEAAMWLIENVFSKIKFKVILAGLNPPQFLEEAIRTHNNIQLIKNPTDQVMDELIRTAQIHCLYTAQDTGLKLKLLNVLFGGRFVICNSNMLSGTGLSQNSGLIISDGYMKEINGCFEKEFSEQMVDERKAILEKFSNQRNIETLIREVFK